MELFFHLPLDFCRSASFCHPGLLRCRYSLCAIRPPQVITRPNTGTLVYELDLQELREKYDRVPDEEQAISTFQQAWTLVGDGTFDLILMFCY